jgi:hypothetical protein
MESKKEMIANSLRMRANYIETGDVCLGRNDAIKRNDAVRAEQRRMGSPTWGEHQLIQIKELTIEQQKLVIAIRELADEIQFS